MFASWPYGTRARRILARRLLARTIMFMTVVDRYLVLVYVKVLIVGFISLAGLFIVIDGFNNLDEFLNYGNHQFLETLQVLVAYYTPRLLQFFDQVAGPLAMFAAAFVLTSIARNNEMTALMAAGIGPARIIRPLLGASIVVSLFAAANREVGLPRVREALSKNAQDWLGESTRKCTPKYDIKSDILITGQGTIAKEKRLAKPVFRLPKEFAAWGRQIAAESANYLTATMEHPTGYVLHAVTQPANLAQLASCALGDELILYSPREAAWLKPDECFVASAVTFEQLAVGNAWRKHLATSELVGGLRNQTIEPGADIYLTLHGGDCGPVPGGGDLDCDHRERRLGAQLFVVCAGGGLAAVSGVWPAGIYFCAAVVGLKRTATAGHAFEVLGPRPLVAAFG
jgi:lipopolysaccharide export system permease protein